MNRATRRQLDRESARLPSTLQEIPRSQWPPRHLDGRLRVLRSSRFLVQVFDAPAPATQRLTVSRTSVGSDGR